MFAHAFSALLPCVLEILYSHRIKVEKFWTFICHMFFQFDYKLDPKNDLKNYLSTYLFGILQNNGAIIYQFWLVLAPKWLLLLICEYLWVLILWWPSKVRTSKTQFNAVNVCGIGMWQLGIKTKTKKEKRKSLQCFLFAAAAVVISAAVFSDMIWQFHYLMAARKNFAPPPFFCPNWPLWRFSTLPISICVC